MIIAALYYWASLVAQMIKNLPAMWETQVQSLVGKIPWRRELLPTLVFFFFNFTLFILHWGGDD